jgi:hypothetical protein
MEPVFLGSTFAVLETDVSGHTIEGHPWSLPHWAINRAYIANASMNRTKYVERHVLLRVRSVTYFRKRLTVSRPGANLRTGVCLFVATSSPVATSIPLATSSPVADSYSVQLVLVFTVLFTNCFHTICSSNLVELIRKAILVYCRIRLRIAAQMLDVGRFNVIHRGTVKPSRSERH